MLSVAVLSDIHGNRRALEAVLSDIEDRRVDQIVNLGDCLYGPFDPTPVADFLAAENWPTVAGNEDRCLVEAAGEAFSSTARFTRDHLTARHIDWLAALPAALHLAKGILAVHGTPWNDRQYTLSCPDGCGGMRAATEAEIVERLGSIDARVILCGHNHLPRVVELRDGRTLINPGSVGCPAYTDGHPVFHAVENGSPHARYALVTLGSEGVDTERIAVSYDWEAAAHEAEANGFPDWATWIRTGRA